MKVLVAEKCGFCHGVRAAISMAEETLDREKGKGAVYSLGPIIHNKDEVERLAKAGLRMVKSINEIESGTVIIRSHGAAPEQIAGLRQKGLSIVDATCVLVKRVQHIAKEMENDGYQVAIVIANDSDLAKLPGKGKLGIVGQTTQGPGHFGNMLGAIGRRSFGELKVINTLCHESIKRQESAVRLCKEVDVMFVLGGLESANTRRLAELCKKCNNETFYLQNWQELDTKMLSGKEVAGVTAGASTPDWIINEFVSNLEAFGADRS